jgi:putative cardiolipin synthase
MEFQIETAERPGKSGFYLLDNGLDAFVARVALARAAERSIDAQYYLLHDDLTGALFIHELYKAADRGVRVRLLVDDMDLGVRDLNAAILDSHPKIDLRLFNPFSRKRFRTAQLIFGCLPVHRRMHNKSFTVDNQVTIVGGRNIGNEYFEANPDLNYSDLDVMGIGPVVRKLSNSFDLYWNNKLAYSATVLEGNPPTTKQIEDAKKELDAFAAEQSDSDYIKALQTSNLARKMRRGGVRFFWGNADVLYDKPQKITRSFDETEFHLSTELQPYFDAIENEVILYSPYFAPGKEGVASLKQLSHRGVTVRILTNSLGSNEVSIVHAGYAKYRKQLLKAGVELYELNKNIGKKERKAKEGPHDSAKASLHAKSFVLDRHQVFIGSLNLDPRALEFNTESGIMLKSDAMAEAMANWFDNNIETVAFRLSLEEENGSEQIVWHGMEGGKPVTYDKDPHTSFLQRFGVGLMSLFPLDGQL